MSPRQSWVSTVQETSSSASSSATARDHGVTIPHGGRHSLGSTPIARRSLRPPRASTSTSWKVSSVCRMPRAMQFHAVAGPYHLVDKAGKSYSQWRDNEERRPSAKEVQRIQDFGGPDRVRSVVEGQENMTINPALRSTALTRCRLSRIQLLFLGLGCHQLGLAVHRLDEGLAVLVPLFVVAYLPNLYFGEPFYLLLTSSTLRSS